MELKEYLESWYLEDDIAKKIRVYNIDLDKEEHTVNKLMDMIKTSVIK